MTKTYKITFKTYFNERLKQVYFHKKPTYPLYVQVTYDRRTIFFKSYFFELFSKQSYQRRAGAYVGTPTLKHVIEEEETLIEYLIERNKEDFNLDKFREDYNFYCRDLCDMMEADFINYLYVFFNDKGMPQFADVIKEGSQNLKPFYLVEDLRLALTKPLYKELVENSFHYGSPYLALFHFLMSFKNWPNLQLTVREWNSKEVLVLFEKFIAKNYTQQDTSILIKSIEKYV